MIWGYVRSSAIHGQLIYFRRKCSHTTNTYFWGDGDDGQDTKAGAGALDVSEEKGISQVRLKKPQAEDPGPRKIRLMTWNIDGLDEDDRRSRTVSVCDTINWEMPDVVFLQEVVAVTQTILEEHCPAYHFITGYQEDELTPFRHEMEILEYYVAIMCRLESTELVDAVVTPFANSKMTRKLLTVKCEIEGEKFHFMTTHLESLRDHSETRKAQLMMCFNAMLKADADSTVVFGGDMNLRDYELTAMGGVPYGICDLWEVTGKNLETKFTWDLMLNDNLKFSDNNKPRLRFDRLYIKHPQTQTVEPVRFRLVGLERVPKCQRFPSDHWGILTYFNILPKLSKK